MPSLVTQEGLRREVRAAWPRMQWLPWACRANANLSAARAFAESTSVGAARFDEALELFNLVNPMLSSISEGEE